VLIVVTEVGQGESIPTAALVSMYGLTPAESRLVDALIGGYTLEQYAQHRGISLGTVRGQLKLVLSKTGATRQSELVRMVLTSAAAQLADPRSRAQRTLN
jgi:DNA-binding CsgD family transcriptional regulator